MENRLRTAFSQVKRNRFIIYLSRGWPIVQVPIDSPIPLESLPTNCLILINVLCTNLCAYKHCNP